jgi:integrase
LKARSIVEVHRHLQVYAKPLHALPLAKIDRRTIALSLSEVEQASGGTSRNRFRSSLSAFYAWAIREGLAEINPVTGTGKASEGNGRERVLMEPELAQLPGALGDDDFSDIVRLLILTGQRREEIGGLRWSEIDWGLSRGVKVLPRGRGHVRRGREIDDCFRTRRRSCLSHALSTCASNLNCVRGPENNSQTLPLGNWNSECLGQKDLIVCLPLADFRPSRPVNGLSSWRREAK